MTILYPIIFLLVLILFVLVIRREHIKPIANRHIIEKQKHYIRKTKAQLKIEDRDSVYTPYTDVDVFIFDNYIIALSPDTYDNQLLCNIVFYKSNPKLDDIKLSARAKIYSSKFDDKVLKMTASVTSYTMASFSYDFTDCYLRFAHIDNQTKNIIEKFT